MRAAKNGAAKNGEQAARLRNVLTGGMWAALMVLYNDLSLSPMRAKAVASGEGFQSNVAPAGRFDRRQEPMRTLVLLFSLTGLYGCVLETSQAEGEEAGLWSDAIVGQNALEPNALLPNGVKPNGIKPNGIKPNGLNPADIPISAMAALQDPSQAGALSRMFIRYAVGCAFDDSQSFAFTWNDGVSHNEKYVGSLGLAPGWQTRGLTLQEQRWVSACIAARTNLDGISVMISIRGGAATLDTTSAEDSAFPRKEGAFWGNLFSDTPQIFSCYDPGGVANARSKNRKCAARAADGAECTPIHSVGACDAAPAFCTGGSDGDHRYDTCGGYSEVLTTFLPD